MANYPGTVGNDAFVGTSSADTFNMQLGGTDSVLAGKGDDIINAGAGFDALDTFNGGEGYDKLDLAGDYSAGVTFNNSTLRNVEEIHFGAGFSYKLATADTTIAAGQILKIDGYNMTAGKSLYIDGSKESDGSFVFYDGQSNDTLIGGAQSDTVSLAYDGADTVHGNGGDDVITAYGSFSNADVVDGGAGNDVLYLWGNYGAGLNIQATAMQSIETLGLVGDFAYALTAADGVVAAGQNLYVTAEGLTGTGKVIFNGAGEIDGTFSFRDGINNDNFSGGANADTFLSVAGGSDTYQGNAGNDTFAMYGNLDATDEVYGGTGKDWLSLDGNYAAGITFDMFTINGIEDLTVSAGHNYKITTDDANVGPGLSLNVGASALGAANHITFNGTAETDGNFNFYGGAGNDIFFGGAGNDYLDAHQGGNDKFYGGDGDDSVSFFDAYTLDDFAGGGDGNDSVFLYADLGPVALGSAQFKNIESITFGPGFAYDITTEDSLVAGGATLAVNTYYSTADQPFKFDGSAETNGHFEITGGDGTDELTGGALSDRFFLNREGDDVMSGGGGKDEFFVSSGFTAADSVDGGTGYDKVYLSATLDNPMTLSAATLTNIEEIDLYLGQSYYLTSNDGNVAAGATLLVDGHFLGAADVMRFNGSAEIDGKFVMLGGAAGDLLQGGALIDTLKGGDGGDSLKGNGGNDKLEGGMGKDLLFGGIGNDTFVFKSVDEIGSGAGGDVIKDWNAGDKIDLSAIDALTASFTDDPFTFRGSDPFNGPGQIRVVSNATTTFVRGDVDGDGAVDFQIIVDGAPPLAASDFIL